MSYYLQGELLGFLLDLAIRDSTDNATSLDDVMRTCSITTRESAASRVTSW